MSIFLAWKEIMANVTNVFVELTNHGYNIRKIKVRNLNRLIGGWVLKIEH
jgi:hypothetical protein